MKSFNHAQSVLITGATSGIGYQLSMDYIDDGFDVTVCGRNAELLGNLYLGRATIEVFDITNAEQTKQHLNQISVPDIVILNAGTCEYIDDVRQFDENLFQRVINTNLMGTVNCLAGLLPNMKAGSQLVIISSSVTYLPFSRSQAYGASKAALDYLAKSLAVDLDPLDISVSLIRPGFVETPLTNKNDFSMPGIIKVKDASRYIMKGVSKRKKEINFPFSFILVMKLFSALPNILWHKIAVSLARAS